MRKPIIVGNWKMNKTNLEAETFFNEIVSHIHDKATFGIGAPFTALATSQKYGDQLAIAAQNCHYEDSGAFTGEISVAMLAELGLKWCIIGHSERRQMFNETDETVNKKALQLLKHDITPIICCGETLEQFEADETEMVVTSQIEKCLKDVPAAAVKDLVIAYEPIWAIGTGKNATKEIAQNTCQTIRQKIAELYSREVADGVRIQYGGSVKPDNIKEYLAEPDIDGALIGGASLKSDSFIEIINALK